jgi:cysteine desulfurase
LTIDVQALGAGFLALAPHRFYGPKGVGVLYRNRRARLASLLHGGRQEGGRRAGTENVAALVGAGVAAELAARDLPLRRAHTARLQQGLWDGLRPRMACTKLNGPEPGPGRLPTSLNLRVEFVEGEGVALAADLQGIAIASGAACATQAMKVSPVLTAIGLDRSLAQGNLLLSLGKDNTEEDVAYVVDKLPAIVAKLRGMSPLWAEYQQGRIPSILRNR